MKLTYIYAMETNYTNYRYSQHNILALIIDNFLTWQNNFDQLMSKLCTACCTIGAIKYFMLQVTLRMIYFSYVHSIMTYGIIY